MTWKTLIKLIIRKKCGKQIQKSLRIVYDSSVWWCIDDHKVFRSTVDFFFNLLSIKQANGNYISREFFKKTYDKKFAVRGCWQ